MIGLIICSAIAGMCVAAVACSVADYANGTGTKKTGNGKPNISASIDFARFVALLPVIPIFIHQMNGTCIIR